MAHNLPGLSPMASSAGGSGSNLLVQQRSATSGDGAIDSAAAAAPGAMMASSSNMDSTSPQTDIINNNNNNALTSSPIGIAQKEVDYYLNPTELFRWINYRRWDGAKARVLSNPDECATWIVSRHSGDGRILWRHLPLHLVCMQSGGSTNSGQKADEGKTAEELATQQRQVEELIDALLDAYPEAASSPDDQGMLPLHLCIANANAGLPNDNILNLLLLANPRAVETKDQYGRTPPDILHEKNVGGAKYEAAVRAMRRAQRTTSTLVTSARQESAQEVESIRAEADKERKANQLTILRLEEEVASIRRRTDDVTNINKEEQSVRLDLEEQIKSLKEALKKSTTEIERIKEERDDLKEKNDTLRSQVDDHDNVLQDLQIAFEKERESQIDEIANLRSEVSTSRAMADAMEAQLRSRFTNEEYLNTTVDELEARTSKIKAEFDRERRQILHDKDTTQTECVQLKKAVEELTAKNITMQGRVAELNKQLSNVLSNHSTLNAEHDRMIDSAVRHETDLIETVRIERESMLGAMKRQREVLDQALSEAKRIMEEARAKEAQLVEEAAEERRTGLEVVERLRKDFRDARAVALERERRIHAENLAGKGRHGTGAAVLSPSLYLPSTTVTSRTSTKQSTKSIKASASSKKEKRGRDSLPSTVVNRSRSNQRVPASPSETSHFSDDTSTVTSPSLAHDRRRRERPNLHVDTDDDRTNPDGNLLRILDNRAEQASSIAPSRGTRDSSAYRSGKRDEAKKSGAAPATSRSSLSRSTSRSQSTRDKEIRHGHGYDSPASPTSHQDSKHHHVKFAPGSWRTGEDSLESSTGRSWSRSRSDRVGKSHRDMVASPDTISLDEYTQKSIGTATEGGNGYRQFSGMRVGMKNQLIRVADHKESSYASRYGVSLSRGEERRNDSSVGEGRRQNGIYSRG